MDSQEFAEAIKRYVMDATIDDTIANLKNPPGRNVPLPALACGLVKWLAGVRSP